MLVDIGTKLNSGIKTMRHLNAVLLGLFVCSAAAA